MAVLVETAYNGRMSDFWSGALLGFFSGIVTGIVASYVWDLRARWLAYKAAGKLVGTWVAYNMHGRTVDIAPMPGAGSTVISSKHHWWSANSAILDIHAQDIDASTGHIRDHDGHIVIDPAFPWLATRITRYADSDEISEQRLVIGRDFNVVYVFPVATVATLGDVFGNHALRRKWEI
jgi:hypothetical protein